MRAILLATLTLAACPGPTEAPEPEGEPTPDPPDAWEVEPNDAEAQQLGPLAPPWSLEGSAARCANGEGWAGTDLDRFRFRLQHDGIAILRILGHGDFDATLARDEQLLWVGDREGTEAEEVELGADPDIELDLSIRCWSGEDASFRLELIPEQ
jgi:hypothetical protein